MSEYIYKRERIADGIFTAESTGEEIVRCRDCKHSIHFFHHDDERWQCTEPHQEGVDVKPNAYCWRGRQKDGGDD